MRTTRSIATLLLACLAVLGPAGSAQAADVARYWIYYSVTDGAWTAANEGFGSTVPKDGSVEGYRYGASTDIPAHITPRADLSEVTFDAVCGGVEAQEGQKRVAVVVDFGVEADAPEGSEPPAPYADCAEVPEKATGYQVLDAVADLRVEQSEWGPSLCGVDSYPASGPCFATVKQASPDDEGTVDVEIRTASAESDTDGAENEDAKAPLLIGAGVVVALLAAGGVLLARRNRS